MARSRRPRRGRGRERFWTQPAMVPTEAGDLAGAHAVRARRWRRLVAAVTMMFPVLVLALLLLTALLLNSDQAADEDASGDGVPTQVRAEALRAVREWLGSEAAPLSDGQVLGWDRADQVPWPDTVEEDDRTHTVWSAHVLVTAADAEGVYDAGVQVHYADSSGAVVIGSPGLEPVPLTRKVSNGAALWPGTESAPAPGPVSRAVQAWAAAYTSGDVEALTTVVADPETSHSYLPLSGFTSVDAQVTGSAWRAYSRGEDPDTSVLMVSVSLSGERDGQDQPAEISLDLLVSEPTTGAARVTAWGAPGSAPQMSPYQNAVVVEAVGGETPVPSPTGSPAAPSGSGTPVPSTSPATTAGPDD